MGALLGSEHGTFMDEWISRLAHAPNHFCYFMGHREAVGRQQIQHLSSLWSPNRLLTLSTSHISQFNKPQISVLPNLPSPFHPPTSNLKSLANCWPRQLSLQRSLWSSDILNTRWFFRGDIELRWAPWRPFFHKGAELRRTSWSAGVNGTFKTWIWWNI